MSVVVEEPLVDEAALDDLVGKIKAFEADLTADERQAFDLDALNNLRGLSEVELQAYLEEWVGIHPAEDAAASVVAAAATIALHC